MLNNDLLDVIIAMYDIWKSAEFAILSVRSGKAQILF